jgi:hypothetical protein
LTAEMTVIAEMTIVTIEIMRIVMIITVVKTNTKMVEIIDENMNVNERKIVEIVESVEEGFIGSFIGKI